MLIVLPARHSPVLQHWYCITRLHAVSLLGGGKTDGKPLDSEDLGGFSEMQVQPTS